ncbi:MAG: CoA transferase [Novosphingobium sp.]|nr:CoA transferase [Novosphingobium sp.]MCP5402822.1 CoA transferase [Novosphingobium sp.]
MTAGGERSAYRPLAGIRILDFSWSLPGPCGTKMLADLGAEVEAVDLSGRPEIFRTLPPLADEASYAWHYVNEGKRRRTVNHRNVADIEAVRGEIGNYDVLVEQFRPGAMAAWGLGYDDLAALNPSLVYCSVSGFGQDGDFRDRAGHDINYLALSGVAHFMRGADGAPALSALPVADLAGGSLHAVIGILAALQGRERTGQGAHVDVSMTDAVWALNAYAGPPALNGVAEEPGTGMLDGGCFYGYYETRDGRWLAVGGIEPKFVDGLFGALERPDLAGALREAAPNAHDHVRAELAKVIATRDFEDWRAFFALLDVCVEPVLTVDEAADHPHFVSRGGTLITDTGQRHFAAPLRFRTPS